MILEEYRIDLFRKYPEYVDYIESKCKILDKIYDDYIDEIKFAYDSKLEEIQKVGVTFESIDEWIEFHNDFNKSDFGRGDHIVDYIDKAIQELAFELDRKQNLKDFDN